MNESKPPNTKKKKTVKNVNRVVYLSKIVIIMIIIIDQYLYSHYTEYFNVIDSSIMGYW